MTTMFDLRTMALLLQQGARVDALSRGALLVGSGWLIASLLAASHTTLVVVALVASVVAAGAQAYYAMRVGFDASLFHTAADAMPTHAETETRSPAAPIDDVPRLALQRTDAPASVPTDPIDAATAVAAMLDDSLTMLGLLPASGRGRDWSARWNGASRLMRRQTLWLGVQLIALLFALAVSLAPAASRTMPA